MKSLYWIRQDFRLTDNPALLDAVQSGSVLPVFIYDDTLQRQPGGASRCWLHHALEKLHQSYQGRLNIFKGRPSEIIQQILAETGIKRVVWNRVYEPEAIARDTEIKRQLSEQGVLVQSFNSSLLWEPGKVLKKDGTPYKVFTPYYRRGCLSAVAPRYPLPAPESIDVTAKLNNSLTVAQLGLLPALDWHKGMMSHWQVGEDKAKQRLAEFIHDRVLHYKDRRDLPSVPGTSRLSPYLHFGEISPNQIWYTVLDACQALGVTSEQQGIDCYLSELGWREFSAYLLYHFPDIVLQNFNRKFDRFPWRKDLTDLQAWQKGQTGIPIVDAGMRELWATGYMHNRVRMIVGSFLVKNLLSDWREGESWFWDCLVDADLASNVASWQWVAGSGADAAPYFRIFNPVTQGQKFDAEGFYIKKWCPELKKLPGKVLHDWWAAKPEILKATGVVAGQTYPKPAVDLKASRQRALDAFATLKQES